MANRNPGMHVGERGRIHSLPTMAPKDDRHSADMQYFPNPLL